MLKKNPRLKNMQDQKVFIHQHVLGSLPVQNGEDPERGIQAHFNPARGISETIRSS